MFQSVGTHTNLCFADEFQSVETTNIDLTMSFYLKTYKSSMRLNLWELIQIYVLQ
ncbi:hypothetical protein LEP1GSC008_3624 [Leptospira kirschneri serovar Bulgarica str. Nikolaevo]|uniref:Uncharacterized protein n=1 Tax=Leptospira kirschneri serovar Bulgarica str. Nikolaevo TaxID=1240687 RepID=M6FTG3_9LEPT|nr:hypothetical protein LEP1GSC008_3624 [Leptospira kirschneri serovar Bulgarica str. Nikolaevo]